MAATKEELDAARAEGRTEGFAAGKTEGAKEGANAARSRIATITGSEAGKKRPAAALKMATSEKFAGVDADAIVEMLADLPEEKAAAADEGKGADDGKQNDGKQTDANATGADQFNAAMGKDKPKVEANGGKKDEDADSADSILAMSEMAGIPGLRKRAS